MRDRRRIVGALFVVAATIAVAPSAGVASPLADCAQRVIRDWAADGSVDDVVPFGCYRAALRALPEDVLQYSDAGQTIEDAMAFSRGRLPEAPRVNGKGATPGVESSATTEPPRTRRTEGVTRPTALSPRVVAASSTPFPSPIVLTGMLALLLLGTGAAGIVVVRRR